MAPPDYLRTPRGLCYRPFSLKKLCRKCLKIKLHPFNSYRLIIILKTYYTAYQNFGGGISKNYQPLPAQQISCTLDDSDVYEMKTLPQAKPRLLKMPTSWTKTRPMAVASCKQVLYALEASDEKLIKNFVEEKAVTVKKTTPTQRGSHLILHFGRKRPNFYECA